MSGSARVESVDAIKEFRVYLTKFQEAGSLALGDADSDINRTIRSLEGEWANLWASQVRKRQEILQKAEEAFRFKRLYKDSSGNIPSAVEEQKAVQVAKKNLTEAQEKLNNVKRWSKQIQKEVVLYRGGVARITNAVAAAVPAAIAHLGATIDNLEKYMGITAETTEAGAPEAVSAGAGAEQEGGTSMARSTEEAPKEEQGVDPAALRAGAPSSERISTAAAAEPGAVKLACGVPTAEQTAAIAALANGQAPPADDERIAIASIAPGSAGIYLLRQAHAWCIGAVDQGDSQVYNTISAGDLRLGRPDLAELLKLPIGSLAVLDSSGVVAVYNQANEKVL
jgi:hypothetical protein